jgi:hypothetical protein
LRKRGKADFKKWLEEFYAAFEAKMTKVMLPVIQSYGAAISAAAADEVGGEPASDAKISDFAKGYVAISTARHVSSGRGQLEALIDEAEEGVDELLLERLGQWDDARAGKLSARERVEACDAFAKMAWVLIGITTMRWVAQGSDPCPYCQELDGRTVGIDKTFVQAGDSVTAGSGEPMTVRGNVMHAPLHAGCECTIVAG